MSKLLLVFLLVFVLTLPVFAQSVDTAWVRRYNGPADTTDVGRAIVVDGSGNVYVTGGSYGSGTGWDYATIKYDSSGNQVWVQRYDGPGSYIDEAFAIVLDDPGNVYVTGTSYSNLTGSDYATIKYDSSGNQLWVQRYSGPGIREDAAKAIALDNSGNVYVTGYSVRNVLPYDEDYITIKYDSSGSQVWVQKYGGPGIYIDEALAIAADGSGNVYVTGVSYGSGTEFDYATIKYDSSGSQVWVQRYNSPASDTDAASAIALDGSGNVYVTGASSGSGTDVDYATIKYDSAGNQVWVQRYSGPENVVDYLPDLAVDGSGNVYVTGETYGSGTNWDYVTIKYVQLPFRRGDANRDGFLNGSDVIFLINYLFKGGPHPDPIITGDPRCDGVVNVSDVIYLINYLFKGGPPPAC